MARGATRARALGLARRLAVGALQRLAREVDRLSVVLEPVREAIPLRETAAWGGIEVWPERPQSATRGEPDEPAATVGAVVPAPIVRPSPAAEPNTMPGVAATEPTVVPEALELPAGVLLVTHVRCRIEPPLAVLRNGAAWEQDDDPVEAIHRLRVATRRLRAFVQLFAPLLGSKRADRLQKQLRKLTRGLGPLRERDVLLAGLRAEHAEAKRLPRAALEHLIGWAEGQRRKAARPARKLVAETDFVTLADALDTELDRVCGRMLRLGDELPAQACAWLEPELTRALEGMPVAQESDLEGLHEIRIRAKRLRYALELLQPVVSKEQWALRRPLKEIQSALGEHRDATQLRERLRERRERLMEQGLETLAGGLEGVEAGLEQRRALAFERGIRGIEGARLDSWTSADLKWKKS